MKKSNVINEITPPMAAENKIQTDELIDNHASVKRRIIDMLDIQLLVAVVIFFVSAWAYLNSVICDFTTTEPYNERMSYILVHYILSIVLVLCIGITYIKGKYLLLPGDSDFTKRERRYIDLFIDGWIWTLILCVCIFIFNNIFWWIGGIVFLGGLC